ncbi:unnamed protein product [marine sediment metagenome]|uniref:Uncharacterized protein n=1 Tax=marine sediment metagenome TaxID=412755 RepID=X0VX86_9ZZZZ
MPSSVSLVLQSVLDEYALLWNGIHGVIHWARVLENGVRLAEETGTNVEVVKLFAVLHDSKRLNDGHDPDHGPRAAEFAVELRGRTFDLPDHEFRLLCKACEGHTHERTHPDITIQTCWDSDRLDLGRVGITPHPSRLCTNVAKLPKTIKWADHRAVGDYVPSFVTDEWGIESA